MKQTLLLAGLMLLLGGCGFKSDLYLPQQPPVTDDEVLPELPQGLAPAIEADPDPDLGGVEIDLAPLEEEQRTSNKKN